LKAENEKSCRTNNRFRQTITQLIRRMKSNKQTKSSLIEFSDVIVKEKFFLSESFSTVNPTSTHNFNETIRASSLTSHNCKRVHWIDDDELIINASYRFLQYLTLFVENVSNEKNDVIILLNNCRFALDELQSFIDCEHIRKAFDDLIRLVDENRKNELNKQFQRIESLISRTVLISIL